MPFLPLKTFKAFSAPEGCPIPLSLDEVPLSLVPQVPPSLVQAA